MCEVCSALVILNLLSGWYLQASAELQGIKGIWSLRASSTDTFDTFLVVSFISETRILAMNVDDELEETEIDGFDSDTQTLFCHNAIHNQLVQVTASTLRLVDAKSRRQLNEWKAPSGISINVSTANASQVSSIFTNTLPQMIFPLVVVSHEDLEPFLHFSAQKDHGCVRSRSCIFWKHDMRTFGLPCSCLNSLVFLNRSCLQREVGIWSTLK
jgi:hypothetical protein